MGGVVGDGVFGGDRVGGVQGNYNFPRITNKIKIFNQISASTSKFIYLMKDLKYQHQRIFPLLGSVKLNLGIGIENQTFFKELQLLLSFFIKLSKK